MDPMEEVSDFGDKDSTEFNSEKSSFPFSFFGNSSSSSRSDEKSSTSLKRKFMDICENNSPQKKLCKYDIKLIADQDSTEIEQKSNYSPENREKVISDENICNDGTGEGIPLRYKEYEMVNESETSISLVSSEKHMDFTLMNENKGDHKSFNKVLNDCMAKIMFRNDSQDTETTINENDGYFSDYVNTNERTTSQEDIANKNKMVETEGKISNSSKSQLMLTALDDYTSTKYTSSSHTLTWKDSQDSNKSGFGESGDCKCDPISNEQRSVDIINVLHPITNKTEEQSTDECFGETGYMDEDGRKSIEISNKIKVTETKEQTSDSLTCNVKYVPLHDTSTITHSHTNTFTQSELIPNCTVKHQPEKILKLENISELKTEVNENVLDHSKNKEKSKKRQSSETRNKLDLLKEATLEKERIQSLIMEYLQNAKMEEFTLNEITEFITKCMPNIPHFKAIHAVRVFVVNNLKSGALKQIGLKYSFKTKKSAIFF